MRRGWKTAGTQRCLGWRNPLRVISLLPWNLHGGLLPCLQNHASLHLQWGKKVFSQPPIVQVLPLKKMREACNFHHRYTSNMRDKIRRKKSRKSHCRIFDHIVCLPFSNNCSHSWFLHTKLLTYCRFSLPSLVEVYNFVSGVLWQLFGLGHSGVWSVTVWGCGQVSLYW